MQRTLPKILATTLHSRIENLFINTGANVYWKANTGQYLGGNDSFFNLTTLPSHDDLTRATDKDLFWHDFAATMVHNDRLIIKNNEPQTFIEPSTTFGGKAIHYLSHKAPLHSHKGKVIGTVGISYQLEDTSWDNEKLNVISLLLGELAANTARKFLLKRHQALYGLTKRQMECLYYLTKGMTIKQIAAQLALSHRTVEHYLEAIREKLGCASKWELINATNTVGIFTTYK